MEVHVFVFEHEHGLDVEAFTSEELAVAEAAGVARRWWSEASGHDASLPEAAPEDDEEAVELYFEAQGGRESYLIAACPVHGIAADPVGM